MAIKKQMTEDEASVHQLIDQIMNLPIPQPMQLSNPLSRNKKRIAMTDGGFIERPAKLTDWTVRHLLDYFAEQYEKALGKKYRKAFQADQHVFHQITAFMSSNGLDKIEWSKALIDWGFDNIDRVILQQKHISPQTLLRMVNYFVQEKVMPLVESDTLQRNNHDQALMEEIQQAELAGKRMEIFSRHGIPVGTTYLTKIKGHSIEGIQESFSKFLTELRKTEEGRTRIRRMIMASIVGSPYPKEFSMLDWRKVFGHVCEAYYAESWWRDVDYVGQPMAKYYALVPE